MISHPSRLLTLVDRAGGGSLGLAGIGLTVSFALIYWILTRTFPEHGIKGLDEEFDLMAALYFSVVTETTLGYGDLRPAGLSRLLVCIQVFLGLAFAGVVVAKITSARGRSIRLISYKASGDWIEVFAPPPSTKAIVTYARISYDGESLHYAGDNFDADGHAQGFFDSKLTGFKGETCEFRYTNEDSTGYYFTHGTAYLQFSGNDKNSLWSRYHATAHDFGKAQMVTYEGFRATDEAVSILRGRNVAARTRLIKQRIAHADATSDVPGRQAGGD